MTTTKKSKTKPRAKRKGATRRRRAKKKASSNWLMLVAGLSIGLLISFLTWLSNTGNPLEPRHTQITNHPAPARPPAKTVQAQQPRPAQHQPVEIIPLPKVKKIEPSIKIDVAPIKKPHFEFYENLPKQTVEAPVSNYSVKKKKAPLLQTPATVKTGKGQYILQAGSFRKHRDAERRIAQLALMGIEARIKKIKSLDNQYWHRVQIGPFTSINDATRMSTRLHSHSIQTMTTNTGK